MDNSENVKHSVFTLYKKYLTTGDGGMITTNDDSLAELCRLWSHHGLPRVHGKIFG